ncbi:MAG: T9SS type A sorting domain-containing protein [Chitinophagaceae bacterium]
MIILIPFRKHIVRITTASVIAACICFAGNTQAGTLPSTGNNLPVRDTILVQVQTSSKKHKIKLYPNASHEVLFFSVEGDAGKAYQLFMFNMEGVLVKQANIKNNQTTVLNNIEKGNYLFEVFSNDQRIENGQVIIR